MTFVIFCVGYAFCALATALDIEASVRRWKEQGVVQENPGEATAAFLLSLTWPLWWTIRGIDWLRGPKT